MASFNKITIVGYLGRDPELRHTPQGNAVCNLSVATTEKNRDKETTTWFRLSVWGKQAELCNQYLKKGSQLYAEGRLRQETYTDREGQPRSNLEVNVTDVKFLGKSGNGEVEQPSQPTAKTAAHSFHQSPVKQEETPDDIPFN